MVFSYCTFIRMYTRTVHDDTDYPIMSSFCVAIRKSFRVKFKLNRDPSVLEILVYLQ